MSTTKTIYRPWLNERKRRSGCTLRLPNQARTAPRRLSESSAALPASLLAPASYGTEVMARDMDPKVNESAFGLVMPDWQ